MTPAQVHRSHSGAWIVRGDGPSRRYSSKSLAGRAVTYREVHGGMSEAQANAFMRDGDWYTSKCDRCGASLERGGGARPRKSGRQDLCCFDCIYKHERAEHMDRPHGGRILRCGSSFTTTAMLRKDMEVYQPHFDAEVVLTPTIQVIWKKYRDHPALNDKHLKRAILVDSSTGAVSERTWGEKFAPEIAAAGTFVIEIFDGLCGYVGIEIYRWGRPEPGMWVQGQVRPGSTDAWLRSTWADQAYINDLSAAVRPLVTPTTRLFVGWEGLEATMREQLLKAYGVDGLV